MIQMVRALGATAFVVASCLGGQAVAQTKQLTLCWAAWDPANALVELSKDFTAKTGIEMKFEFVPVDELRRPLPQRAQLEGQAVRPASSATASGSAAPPRTATTSSSTTSSPKKNITMDDFMPATVVGYSEWPKNTPNYWALPAMGDAVGWTYRKDWFARPELQAEFKKKYGRDLAPPKT